VFNIENTAIILLDITSGANVFIFTNLFHPHTSYTHPRRLWISDHSITLKFTCS